jgi:outer membrane protein assembly factor BamB
MISDEEYEMHFLPNPFVARLKPILQLCALVLCVDLLIGCQALFEATPSPISPNLTPLPTPQPVRVISESTLDLVELWRFHTGPINVHSVFPPHLHVTNGKVLISSFVSEKRAFADSLLTALSLETGQIVWQTYLEDPWNGTGISASHLDEERLYLVYSFQVNAFSLKTGELLWSTPNPKRPGGTGYWFNPWDPVDPLLWHSSAEEVIALDPQTGEILWRREEKGPMIQQERFDFVYRYEDGLYIALHRGGQVSWAKIEPWPSFVSNDLLFEVGVVCYDIIRADVQTKQVTWETSGRNYLSNFALTGSQLYALQEDLTLVALDLDNGTIVGTLEFDGPPAETICKQGGSDVYWVVADGPHVLVYFGDSRELIAFKEQVVP